MTYEFETGLSIDFEDYREVSVLGAPEDTYRALSSVQQENLEEAIETEYARGDEITRQNQAWKTDSSNIIASRHEKLFKEALGIDTPLRKQVSYTPSAEQQQLARELQDLSSEYLEHNYGEEITLHRGIKYESRWILPSILNNPSQDQHSPPDNELSALTNYTFSRKGAAYFHGLIVTQESVPISDIAIAANYLFVYEEGVDENLYNLDGIYSPNGEVRLRGDREYSVEKTDIKMAIDTPEEEMYFTRLFDLLENPSGLSIYEHSAMKDVLKEIEKSDKTVTNSDTIDMLENWRDSYNDICEHEATDLIYSITDG